MEIHTNPLDDALAEVAVADSAGSVPEAVPEAETESPMRNPTPLAQPLLDLFEKLKSEAIGTANSEISSSIDTTNHGDSSLPMPTKHLKVVHKNAQAMEALGLKRSEISRITGMSRTSLHNFFKQPTVRHNVLTLHEKLLQKTLSMHESLVELGPDAIDCYEAVLRTKTDGTIRDRMKMAADLLDRIGHGKESKTIHQHQPVYSNDEITAIREVAKASFEPNENIVMDAEFTVSRAEASNG